MSIWFVMTTVPQWNSATKLDRGKYHIRRNQCDAHIGMLNAKFQKLSSYYKIVAAWHSQPKCRGQAVDHDACMLYEASALI
jgi:hypothetical protein